MPNALGRLIAESDLHDLGMHTELCSDGYLAMFRAGKLTNRRKPRTPARGVYGLAVSDERAVRLDKRQPGLMAMPLSYVNDPYVIAKNDGMISINGRLNADLYGQVASESAGTRQISGTGGQLDFVTGATLSRGGKAFCAWRHLPRQGRSSPFSRLCRASAAILSTTPRSQAYYVVTEYGAANLAGRARGACGRDDIHRPPRLPRRAYTRGRATENMRRRQIKDKYKGRNMELELHKGRPADKRIDKEERRYALSTRLG